MKVLEFKTAKGFLNSLINLHLKNNSFIYRGQSNADWQMIPSVLREGCNIPTNEKIKQSPLSTVRWQREAELEAIHLFIEELNKKGFHIPNEYTLFRTRYDGDWLNCYNKITRCEEFWPSKEYLSIMAVAQHYGLPTRLLDFSYSPLVASYFAAHDYFYNKKYKNENITHIAVFAANTRYINFSCDSYTRHETKEPWKLKSGVEYFIVIAPTFFNENLRSQQGLFLAFTEVGNVANNNIEVVSLEEYLNNIDNSGEKLLKYTLNVKHVPKLLHYLEKLNISTSNMFPTIEGCIKSTYERSFFAQKFPDAY